MCAVNTNLETQEPVKKKVVKNNMVFAGKPWFSKPVWKNTDYYEINTGSVRDKYGLRKGKTRFLLRKPDHRHNSLSKPGYHRRAYNFIGFGRSGNTNQNGLAATVSAKLGRNQQDNVSLGAMSSSIAHHECPNGAWIGEIHLRTCNTCCEYDEQWEEAGKTQALAISNAMRKCNSKVRDTTRRQHNIRKLSKGNKKLGLNGLSTWHVHQGNSHFWQ